MQTLLDNLGTTISIIIAIFALIIAILTWLFPRSPSKKRIPEYFRIITSESQSHFARFLDKHENKIIYLRVMIHVRNEDDIVSEEIEYDGTSYYTVSLNKNYKDSLDETIKISFRPKYKEMTSPLIYEGGSYHLKGFFVFEYHPGGRGFRGLRSASLTEIAAERLAL